MSLLAPAQAVSATTEPAVVLRGAALLLLAGIPAGVGVIVKQLLLLLAAWRPCSQKPLLLLQRRLQLFQVRVA